MIRLPPPPFHPARPWRTAAAFFALVFLLGPQLGLASSGFQEVEPWYTDQPEKERNFVYSDLNPPEALSSEQLTKVSTNVPWTYTPKIFNQRISREFKDRYERTFGDTHIEQAHRLPMMGGESRVTFRHLHRPEENLEKQRAFGEYVAQRLADHHLDRYLKESRRGKAIQRVKEQVQNTQVRLSSSTRVRTRFMLLNQQLDVSVINPMVTTRVLWDPSLSQPYLILTRKATRKLNLRGHIDWSRSHYRLSASERVNPLLTATLTGISRKRTEAQEYMVVAGLSYIWP